MSEKSALRLEVATQSPAEPPSSNSLHKARRRARLYKAACFYFSIVMANIMHKFAVANSRDADKARWNELIAPVNARLSPWILLFSAPLSGPSRPSFLDTTWFFIAAIFSYTVYARFYYQWNQQNDRYQLPILVVAALVGIASSLGLNVGFMISVFCVTPKVALFGLLASDMIHLVFQGPWKENIAKKPVLDVEKGLQSTEVYVVDVGNVLQSGTNTRDEEPRLDGTSRSECQQICCWHLRSFNGTSEST